MLLTTSAAPVRSSGVTLDPTFADASDCAWFSRSLTCPSVESTSDRLLDACLMLDAYICRVSSVFCNCMMIDDVPGSSLGVRIFCPVDNWFCTCRICFCVDVRFCVATGVRRLLLTRARLRG